MTVEVANGVAGGLSYPNGDLKTQNPSATAKKSRESERRRRRRKQKKNKAASGTNNTGDESDNAAAASEDANGTTDNDSAKENSDPQKVCFIFTCVFCCFSFSMDHATVRFLNFVDFAYIGN